MEYRSYIRVEYFPWITENIGVGWFPSNVYCLVTREYLTLYRKFCDQSEAQRLLFVEILFKVFSFSCVIQCSGVIV